MKNNKIQIIEEIEHDLSILPDFILRDSLPEKTAIIVVDMINGFASEGNLYSARVEKLIQPISEIIHASKGMKKVFLCDRHPENAPEFESYLPHAIEGTREALIVDELYSIQDELSSVIFKNCTNGMMVKEMRRYLKANEAIETFIVIGDCTDICIMQFALSLKAYFNEINLNRRVVVPISLVETFDLEATKHDAELMSLFAFYNMKMNGIELYQSIKI